MESFCNFTSKETCSLYTRGRQGQAKNFWVATLIKVKWCIYKVHTQKQYDLFVSTLTKRLLMQSILSLKISSSKCILTNSVAELHHFYAAPAPGKNFDAAPAPAPTLLYRKAKILK
jgi:hypothetical protein